MSGGIRFGWPWRAAACCGMALAAVSAAMPTTARAGSVEYCVTCKSPAASYRCRLQGSGVTQSDALKLYCVVRTTKEGGHASCAAKSDPNCAGLVKVYTYDGPALPSHAPADARVRDLNQRMEQENRAFEDKRGNQPKSLIELGGRAYDASKRGLQGAGAAIGLGNRDPQAQQQAPQAAPQPAPPPPAAQAPQAVPPQPKPQKNFARRSWDCMTSLFRECGNE